MYNMNMDVTSIRQIIIKHIENPLDFIIPDILSIDFG